MSRDPYTEQRLINWGRWKAGVSAGGLGYASTAWGAFDAGDRYSTKAPVLPDGDDAITDQAVCTLTADLQDALDEQYVQGGTIELKAQRRGCHPETFRSRVNAGVRGVSAWLVERERMNRSERDRVEALHRAQSSQLAARVTQAVEERARTDRILGIAARRATRRSK